MNDRDSWDAAALGLTEREAAELAGCLAASAGEGRPPAALKARVFARLRARDGAGLPGTPPRSSRRRPAALALLAVAALAIALFLPRRGADARVGEASGAVFVDGEPARAGQALRRGQTVSTPGGEAVLVFGRRAAARLLPGAEASYRGGRDVELRLRRGRLLSVVAEGTRYSVSTAQGRIAVLGTEFLSEARGAETFFCICRGRLRVHGSAGTFEAASESHAGWVLEGSGGRRRTEDGSMPGHRPEEIRSLRRFLDPAPGR